MFSEITAQIMFSKEQAIAAMQAEGYKLVKKCLMHDMYYTHLPRGKKYAYPDLMANSVVVRRMNGDYTKLLYKQKFFDEKGNVFTEEKIECVLENWHDAVKIFGMANLHMWCEKKAELHVFESAGREICLQDVEGLGLFIEIKGDTYTKSISDLISVAKSIGLPLDDDFHVKLPYLIYLNSLA